MLTQCVSVRVVLFLLLRTPWKFLPDTLQNFLFVLNLMEYLENTGSMTTSIKQPDKHVGTMSGREGGGRGRGIFVEGHLTERESLFGRWK